MGKILIGIYLAGGLAVIYGAATIIETVLRKQKKFTEEIIKNRMAAVMAFMLVFAPAHWINSNFNNAILDGTYRINAAVTFPHSNEVLYLPADIHISSDVEYRDSYYYLGAVEMESSKAAFNRTIYLWGVYWWDGITEIFSCDKEIRAEHTEEIWTDEGTYEVNIGVITKETLGISNKDIWDQISLVGKLEMLAICLSCVLGLVQYFVARAECVQGANKSFEEETVKSKSKAEVTPEQVRAIAQLPMEQRQAALDKLFKQAERRPGLMELWQAGLVHVLPSEDWEEFKPAPLTEEDLRLEEELFRALGKSVGEQSLTIDEMYRKDLIKSDSWDDCDPMRPLTEEEMRENEDVFADLWETFEKKRQKEKNRQK